MVTSEVNVPIDGDRSISLWGLKSPREARRIPIMTASKPSGLWSAAPGEVLVVDDEYAARAVLSRWIEAEGFVVSGAPDAETALDILAERDIAVVTVDKDMPGHGGMWLVGEIQKR